MSEKGDQIKKGERVEPLFSDPSPPFFFFFFWQPVLVFLKNLKSSGFPLCHHSNENLFFLIDLEGLTYFVKMLSFTSICSTNLQQKH